MSGWLSLVLACLSLLSGCARPHSNPHYELGNSYQVKGFWHYPNESYELNETGLATTFPAGHAALTSNGEVFDQSIAMAGHPTLQLPAMARLTNLENGRSLLVRINDRGTGDPHRLVEVTARAATLLAMQESATPVRLQVLPMESRAAVDGLPGAPVLAVAAAPRDVVHETTLSPLPGSRQEAGNTANTVAPIAAAEPTAVSPPARLPETVTQEVLQPGRLWVRLDTFEEYQYAAVQRARVGKLGARIESSFDRRRHRFWVRIGPLETVRQADDALDAALAAGIPDARIVVE